MEPQQQPQWQYKPSKPAASAQDFHGTPTANSASSASSSSAPAPAPESSFSWTAAEYFEHSRSPIWYPALFLLTAAIAGAVYLVTKDYFATGTIVVLGVIVAFAAGRKPKEISCQVSSGGITIGPKTYQFGQFRSFGIIRESQIPSLEFIPTKKFMPSVAVHFNAQDEAKITGIVGNYLPYEERKMAGIDKLSHRLGF